MEPKSTSPRSILAEAADVVAARGKRYGSPMANHNRTAQLWGAYLGVELTAADVCKLNILQKLSRDRHQANRDNLVDVAGYVENALLAEPGNYNMPANMPTSDVDPATGHLRGCRCFGCAGIVTPFTSPGFPPCEPDDLAERQQRMAWPNELGNERAAHDRTHRQLDRVMQELDDARSAQRVAREDAEAQRRKADDLGLRLADVPRQLAQAHALGDQYRGQRDFARSECDRLVEQLKGAMAQLDRERLDAVDLRNQLAAAKRPQPQCSDDCNCPRCR